LLEEIAWQTIPKPQEGNAVSFDITVKMQTQIECEYKTLSLQ